MGQFTYDDFQRELDRSGLGKSFSDADLRLARSNPDAGMSILRYKMDYNAANTDEARALANLGAEGVRSSYGNYTGGNDGAGFYLNPLSPNSFTFSGDKPSYENRYDEKIQALLDQITNRQAFSYDPETDQLYSQYRKQYAREGQRASQDTLGTAAAASGGLPSSYAVTAASQAGDHYAAQMTDKIPELYQLAYNQYMNEHNMKLNDLSAVMGAEQNDYSKYLNDLQQYNTDRGFDYSVLLDEINQQTQLRNEAMDKAKTAAGYGDFSFLRDMGIKPDGNGLYQFEVAAAGRSGSGGYSGGGYAGSGGGTTAESGEESGSDGTAGYALTGQEIATLQSKFPGGVIDGNTWDSYVAYGVPEAALTAAGFRKGGNSGTGGQSGGGTGDSGISAVRDYDSAIAYMKKAGVSESVRRAMLTKPEWLDRKATLQRYGTGGSEVKNYSTYEAYVRDYARYAGGK